MDFLAFLIVVGVIWLILAPAIALGRASTAREEAKEAKERADRLLARVQSLEERLLDTSRVAQPSEEPPVAEASRTGPPDLAAIAPTVTRPPLSLEPAAKSPQPPPLPPAFATENATPPLPSTRPPLVDYGDDGPPTVRAAPALPKEPFSLEKFMGVKLFAWMGGVAMFFGITLFVKYAFENNLISPSTRIILGFISGAGLIIAGLVTHRLPKYRVLAQAFCATGILVLYAVSFAAHAIYHFPMFGTLQTFVLMALVTFGAFFMAVRLNALVVAALGMLGGFMTPVLLATGEDQVFALFGYITLLNVGLLAVSRHGRWQSLTSWAAAGTAVIQIFWHVSFFNRGDYGHGAATLIPMGILLFFILLFGAGGWIGKKQLMPHAAGAVTGLGMVAMLFAFAMLLYPPVAQRVPLLYGFIFLVQLAMTGAVLARPQLAAAQLVNWALTFIHLATWSTFYLREENLISTLLAYLVFGALHAILPVLLSRTTDRVPSRVLHASPWISPLVVLMMAIPLVTFPEPPMILWAGVFVANLMLIPSASSVRVMLPLALSLVVTLTLAVVWLGKLPVNGDSLQPFLAVTGGLAAFFCIASMRLSRTDEGTASPSIDARTGRLTTALSGILPFGLLVLALGKMRVVDPTPVFTTGLALSALLAGLSMIRKQQGPLILIALAGLGIVEAVWHGRHFQRDMTTVALSWYIGIHLLFLAFPIVFRKWSSGTRYPWIAAALAGGHFILVHDAIRTAYPATEMGLIPAAYAIPYLAAIWWLLKAYPVMDDHQKNRLAWVAGVALFFVTLIFPIQFERQWITVSWAIEGALLLWLFRRVPHRGLQFTGLALLGIAFIRLTLNPEILTSYPRDPGPILNWQLYSYGLVALAHFFGARWFTDPRSGWNPINVRVILYVTCGLLLFLLLNIQIADYFTTPGRDRIDFSFRGNFQRDMTYSISWGLFALALLGIGFRTGSRYARYAAVTLLVLTLVKVFTHDLATIKNIFRIIALVGVALIAFVASFLYQRFFDRPPSLPPEDNV